MIFLFYAYGAATRADLVMLRLGAGLQRSGGSWTAGVDTNKLPLLPLSKFPRRGSPITEDRRTLAVSTSCPNAMKTKLEPW